MDATTTHAHTTQQHTKMGPGKTLTSEADINTWKRFPGPWLPKEPLPSPLV